MVEQCAKKTQLAEKTEITVCEFKGSPLTSSNRLQQLTRMSSSKNSHREGH